MPAEPAPTLAPALDMDKAFAFAFKMIGDVTAKPRHHIRATGGEVRWPQGGP